MHGSSTNSAHPLDRGGNGPLNARSRRGMTLGALTACLAAMAAGAVMTISSPQGTVAIEAADPEVRVTVTQGGKLIEIADQSNQWSVRLREGTYEVSMQGGDDRLELSGQQLVVRRGETTRVTVKQTALKDTASHSIDPFQPAAAKPSHVDTASDTNSFAGQWQITAARGFGGHSYSGRVQVKLADDGLARLSWYDPDARQAAQTGLGFVRDGHLLAAWGAQADFGVVLYEIRQDGTLEGIWTHSIASQQLGKETAKGGQPGRLDGTYQVRGSSIAEAGGAYEGELSIERRGDVYNIAWDAAGSKFSGIGMRQGKWLIVGWSLPDGGPYGVVDYQLKGSVAAGRWTMVGQESLETENLKRADAP